jgi:hypothetical protein
MMNDAHVPCAMLGVQGTVSTGAFPNRDEFALDT